MAVPDTGALRGHRFVDLRERFPADAVQIKMVDSALGQVAFRIGKHHKGNASLFAETSVGMAKVGIKIDGIAGAHAVLITAQQQAQRSPQNMDELEPQVRMGPGVRVRKREKLSQIRMKLSLSSSGVEPGQDVRVARGRGQSGELIAFLLSRDRNQMAALLILEKMVQSHIERQGDTQQRGYGGNQLAIFNLGQKGG